jgi:hypothetical protein
VTEFRKRPLSPIEGLFYKKVAKSVNPKIDIVTLSLRIDGPSVFKMTHFKRSQVRTQIWRLENRTVTQKQVKSNWSATKTQNSNLLT